MKKDEDLTLKELKALYKMAICSMSYNMAELIKQKIKVKEVL